MLTNPSKLKSEKHRNYFTGIIYRKDDHEGKDDWQFTLIDQCTTNAELGKKSFIGNIVLKTFFPNGLNECEESCL